MIFPNLDAQTTETTLPMYRDWALDETRQQLATRGGKPYYVDGLPALRTWIWKALVTDRNTYSAYSKEFGNDLRLIERTTDLDIVKSELKRLISEALLVSPYIKNVRDFSFERSDSAIYVTCTVDTVYGETEVSYEHLQ
jgi:hypothetical protein